MTAEDDATIRNLAARGIRAVHASEWTPQASLDVIRDGRRRHASDDRMQALGRLGARLAKDVTADTGVPAADIAAVLLSTGAKLSALAVLHGVDAVTLTEVMAVAGDDLDQISNPPTEGTQCRP